MAEDSEFDLSARHLELARRAVAGAQVVGESMLFRVGKAIQAAEERGTPGAMHRAWNEGWSANEICSSHDLVEYEEQRLNLNPYPAPEKP